MPHPVTPEVNPEHGNAAMPAYGIPHEPIAKLRVDERQSHVEAIFRLE